VEFSNGTASDSVKKVWKELDQLLGDGD
jgi:hypothetical protein